MSNESEGPLNTQFLGSDPALVETVARALFEQEYIPVVSDAHADYHRWTWLGDGHSEEFKDTFRNTARAVLSAIADDLEGRDDEVVHLTEVEAREAARSALAESGYTYAKLADQASRDRFDSLGARLTWEAVRYVGDPDHPDRDGRRP